MLLYIYMSNGSLASHLYGKKKSNSCPLIFVGSILCGYLLGGIHVLTIQLLNNS